jgi:hypothetical protein
MAVKVWQTIKVQNCRHAGGNVSLEAEVLLPEEHIPDQSPRIVAHRCSRGVECGLMDEASCVWSGTNPTYDPFAEPSSDTTEEKK